MRQLQHDDRFFYGIPLLDDLQAAWLLQSCVAPRRGHLLRLLTLLEHLPRTILRAAQLAPRHCKYRTSSRSRERAGQAAGFAGTE